ncbi:MAG TPA: hypothetical protein VK835_00455, partial [Bacteroidia bacterium]|nr:hypothetical protein [Bacteroidia bacterium]
MVHYLKIFFALHVLFLGCSYTEAQNLAPAYKLNVAGLTNLYRVDDSLYRCEQPSNFGLIDSIGIKTVINLRQRKTDNHKIKKTNLKLINVPMNAWTIS